MLPAVRRGFQLLPCTPAGGGAPGRGRAECLDQPRCGFFADTQRCLAKPRKRAVVDCGYADADACRAEGCLWTDGAAATPCRKPAWMLAGRKPATIPTLHPGQTGSDCGWASMTPQECVQRGCEWGQPKVDPGYAPWCRYL